MVGEGSCRVTCTVRYPLFSQFYCTSPSCSSSLLAILLSVLLVVILLVAIASSHPSCQAPALLLLSRRPASTSPTAHCPHRHPLRCGQTRSCQLTAVFDTQEQRYPRHKARQNTCRVVTLSYPPQVSAPPSLSTSWSSRRHTMLCVPLSPGRWKPLPLKGHDLH